MVDTLNGVPRSDVRSPSKAANITAADVDLPFVPTQVYVGNVGSLVMLIGGTVVTLENFSGHCTYRPTQIMAASTASNIVISA